MRLIIKKIYIIAIVLLNMIFKPFNVNSKHIVIMMTFKQDVLPIIEALCSEGYHVTVIGKKIYQKDINNINHAYFIPAGNKYIMKHMKVLSKAKVIILDTYYLMMGGYQKKKGQIVIQTWHAAGALKNFGLTDHQVDLKNKAMVRQYKKVYDATDYYLVGGEKMAQCFIQSFDASPSQMLKFGLPRLTQYFRSNLKLEQQRLKKKYHITNKLAVYVPTYREGQVAQRTIDKENFERHLPNYTLLSHLHPSTVDCQTAHSIDVTSLLIMADIIISDYSSLPIEASALNKPTLIYNYDEQQYEKVRGLNEFYYAIPERYKMSNEESIIQAIHDNDEQFQSLFNDWHQYNSKDSLNQLVHFINKLVK